MRTQEVAAVRGQAHGWERSMEAQGGTPLLTARWSQTIQGTWVSLKCSLKVSTMGQDDVTWRNNLLCKWNQLMLTAIWGAVPDHVLGHFWVWKSCMTNVVLCKDSWIWSLALPIWPFYIYKIPRPRNVFTTFARHSASVEQIKSEISMENCLEKIRKKNSNIYKKM